HRLLRTLTYQSRPATGFARSGEVNPAVNSPNSGDSKSGEGFHLGANSHEREDNVSAHARQVGEQTKQRNEQVLDRLVVRVIVEADNTGNTAEHVKQEGAEVRGQRDGYERIG